MQNGALNTECVMDTAGRPCCVSGVQSVLWMRYWPVMGPSVGRKCQPLLTDCPFGRSTLLDEEVEQMKGGSAQLH